MATRTAKPTHQFADLEPGKFRTVSKVLGADDKNAGSLEARRLADGSVRFYWRMTRNGKADRIAIGQYDPSAPPMKLEPTEAGYSVTAAQAAAHRLAAADAAARKDGFDGGLRAKQEADAAAAQAERDAAAQALEQARKAAELAAQFTLLALVNDYAQHLQGQGKPTAVEVRSLIRRHIAPSSIAQLPAHKVTPQDLADLLRAVNDKGLARTRERVRTTLHRAFELAVTAPYNDAVPVRFKGYACTTNPAKAVPRLQGVVSDKNPLSLAELRTYWEIIKTIPGLKGAVLRAHLLLGGQRPRQLCAARRENLTGYTITLVDTKGRRLLGQPPRRVVLPLPDQVAADLAELPPGGEWLFSTDGGKSHLTDHALAGWAKDAVGDRIPGFTIKRIRSAVETHLAGAKVSDDIRGRLQSHGIGGVQDRHYNDHDYLVELDEALQVLADLLEGRRQATVLPFRRAA